MRKHEPTAKYRQTTAERRAKTMTGQQWIAAFERKLGQQLASANCTVAELNDMTRDVAGTCSDVAESVQRQMDARELPLDVALRVVSALVKWKRQRSDEMQEAA